jgi:hypothetical protein
MWLKTEGWFTSSCSTLLNQPGENCIDVRFSILFISLIFAAKLLCFVTRD